MLEQHRPCAAKVALSRFRAPVVWPDRFWDHPVFHQPAHFPDGQFTISAQRIDAAIRRAKNMPSTCDQAAPEALERLNRLYEQGRDWLRHDRHPTGRHGHQLLRRLARVRQVLSRDAADRMAQRMAQRCLRELDETPAVAAWRRGLPLDLEPVTVLERAEVVLTDALLCAHPRFRRSYFKKIYVNLAQALQYNATADTGRVEPLLRWIRAILEQEPLRNADYADVGCSMATGARSTLSAVDILRPGRLVRRVHGIDVTPPDRTLAHALAREQHVLLYAADSVAHPLPRCYDVILLANVHRHLTPASQRAMLNNLARSLNRRGRLFVNWRFSATSSPCLYLRKQAGRMELVKERNLP